MSARPCVAVVGAGGFIGTRLVEMLHLEGDATVRPIVRQASALASAARFALDGRVADARDLPALRRALHGAEIVVHAVAGDPATITSSAVAVYQAAAAAGCRRLVYLSSAAVHGQSPEPGTDERSPLSDRQPIAYNNAKVRAERALAELRRGGRVELVVLRPAIVFGPRSAWIAALADAYAAGTAHFAGTADGICNALYVDDLVHAVRLAATAPADGETYLVGDDAGPTWRELYRPFVEALGGRIEVLPIVPYVPPERGLAERLERVRASAPVQSALQRLPERLRLALVAFYAAAARRETSVASAITPTHELALLHACRVKLPWEKARRELGYAPPVGVAEGIRRTLGWLAFAGYPLKTGAPS
jgi:nucleoside-diphosphate-sugar epimerase